jgi:AraC family transcriptional activator of pobA
MLEFTTIRAFYEFLQVPLPPDEDFAIQRLEASQRLRAKLGAPVFRHRFYGISLQLTGNVHYQAGGQQRYMDQPFVFFSSPHQLTSWQLPTAAVVRGYHMVFTEAFLRRYPALAVLVSRLPFLQLGHAVPFAVDPADVTPLLTSYQQIAEEYDGSRPDRYDLIATQTQLLLFQVRRLYEKAPASPREEPRLAADEALASQFNILLAAPLRPHDGAPRRTVAHYARELSVSVRTLDEALKQATGRTAHALVHEHLLRMAQALLVQTSLSIKEIAYQLEFNEPAHFTNFFKKYTQQTPLQFRQREQQ